MRVTHVHTSIDPPLLGVGQWIGGLVGSTVRPNRGDQRKGEGQKKEGRKCEGFTLVGEQNRHHEWVSGGKLAF